ncbi:MAG: MarR family transcriptional regulator [Acetobacteraceae bacterium]|nr:MarR family transcriptional regulator [Acetobacteraceae bacterium]
MDDVAQTLADNPRAATLRSVVARRVSRPYRLDASTGHLLRRAHQRYQALFQEHAAGLGLTGPQFAALLKLSELGRATQNQLGRAVAMDPATAQGVVRRLIARGFVRSSQDPMDRRTLVLTLTEEGDTVLEEARLAGARAHEMLLDPLSEPERQQLMALLARLSIG